MGKYATPLAMAEAARADHPPSDFKILKQMERAGFSMRFEGHERVVLELTEVAVVIQRCHRTA